MNGKFIDNGQSEHYQHFFVVKDQKPFPDFDAKLDNPTNQEFMRYDYVDGMKLCTVAKLNITG